MEVCELLSIICVIPAKAGIYHLNVTTLLGFGLLHEQRLSEMDPRFRGDDARVAKGV